MYVCQLYTGDNTVFQNARKKAEEEIDVLTQEILVDFLTNAEGNWSKNHGMRNIKMDIMTEVA